MTGLPLAFALWAAAEPVVLGGFMVTPPPGYGPILGGPSAGTGTWSRTDGRFEVRLSADTSKTYSTPVFEARAYGRRPS